MESFEPVLLANIQRPDSHTLAVYEATGGYQTLRRALRELSPAQVVDEVRRSGLRGRGGAGFPTGLKWSFLPADHPGPIYLCVNADESEPGTFCNRVLMELDPHQVLEGTILSAYATRATTAYIYLRYEYPLAYRRLQAAIDEAYAAGYLGRNILGSGFSLDVYIHRGAGAYICGEETGLIESIEGKRAWPRSKPPFPAVEGLFRKPTVVNNVETLACVKHIIERGADWFRSIGVPPSPDDPRDPGSFGPKLFCISGHVNKPGCYEAPLGISCRELIEKFGGGVWKGRRAKAVVPGGLSTGVLSVDELDVPMDFVGPVQKGCLGLGTGGVIVMDETYPMIEFLHNSCRFFAHESCGQCTPCREGTSWALQIVRRIKAGRGRLVDLDLLLEIADNIGIIPGTTICGLADGAAWPIKTAIRKFREELEDYIKRTNPTGYKTRRPVPALDNGSPSHKESPVSFQG
ncbi:NADH-ubiquinone oxidoreductase chain F [Thermogutta terrifontis]|uniref:NADH-ubiquinone oxidoreductase chain F n=1 Tax=Thermogutta terrifontis TaxID=1331910 RepID=A0A286RBM1_9BACT|nr:NADH-quinone oxidoreductase subunit NuoF [Thermogutta terrifontis]ASV73374.1 NADH-ubiquinone oxidoreductase chain F [Thermogutta terrifontis]